MIAFAARRAMILAFLATLAVTGAIGAIPAVAAPASDWGPPEIAGGQAGDSGFAKTPIAAINPQDDAIVAWATPERVGRGFRDRVIVRHRIGRRGRFGPPARLGFGLVEAVAVSRRHGRLVVWRTGTGQLVAARRLGSGRWRAAKVAQLATRESRVRGAAILTDGGAALVVESRRPDPANARDALESTVARFSQATAGTRWRRSRFLLSVPAPGLDAAAINERGAIVLAADFQGAGRASLTPAASATWVDFEVVPGWSPALPPDPPSAFDPGQFQARVGDLLLDRAGRPLLSLHDFPSAAAPRTRVFLRPPGQGWQARLTRDGTARVAWTAGSLVALGGRSADLGPAESGVVVTPVIRAVPDDGVLSPDPLTTLVRHPAGEDGEPRTPFHVALAEDGRVAAMWHTVEGPGPDRVFGSGHAADRPWAPVTPLGASRTVTQLVAGGRSALALIDMSEGGTDLVLRRFDGLPRFQQIGARRSAGRLILRVRIDRAATLRGVVRSRDTGEVRRVPVTRLTAGLRRVDVGPRPAGRYALRLELCLPAEGCAPGRRLLNVR